MLVCRDADARATAGVEVLGVAEWHICVVWGWGCYLNVGDRNDRCDGRCERDLAGGMGFTALLNARRES